MRRHDTNEDGAVLPLVAVTMTLLIGFTAFAIDLGLQRVARRDMQSLSDIVALDMARQLQGRTLAQINADIATGSASPWNTALSSSLARNDKYSLHLPSQTPSVSVLVGMVNPATGVFTPEDVSAYPATTIPTAVKATASTSIKYSLTSGTANATRSAVGVPSSNTSSAATACFKIGSYALGFNTAGSSLNQALPANVFGQSLSYKGLASAGASIPLAQLATALGLGSTDQLGTAQVTAAQVATATATVLAANGDPTDAAIANRIAAASAQAGGPTVNFGKVVGVAPGSGSALTGSVNALDIIEGTALVASGTQGVSVPSLATNVAQLGTGFTTSVGVVQSPQSACGPIATTMATTAQGTVHILGQLNLPVAVAGLTAVNATAPVDITTAIAQADGTLAAIACKAGTLVPNDGETVSVINKLASVSGTFPVTVTVAGLTAVTLKVTFTSGTSASSPTDVPMTFPTDADYATAYPVGGGGLGLSFSVTASQVTAVGVTAPVAGTIATAVANTIANSFATPLNNIVMPLAQAVGVTPNGADVFGILRPNCSSATLVGNGVGTQ